MLLLSLLLCVLCAVYVTANVSGGHLNPAGIPNDTATVFYGLLSASIVER
jgi:hypothetical protein